MNRRTTTLAALALGFASTGVAAQSLDGKAPLICAATSTVVCVAHDSCVTGPPEDVNLPVFWHVDPTAKVVRSKSAGGTKRTSPITTVASEGGKLVLQGSDKGLGWSVSIDPSSGKMVLTGGRDVGYLVFGACTAL